MAFVEDIINNEIEIERILQLEQECGYAQHITATKAAIIIQRHYRGHYTRLYISMLNSAAVIIQRLWKRYTFKKRLDELAIQTFATKAIEYYNKAATVIQRHFKGYYTRKHHMDFQKNKKWLKDNQKTNDEWLKVMLDYKQNISTELEKINKETLKCMAVEIVHKKHPMLRTKHIKGVFSNKGNVHCDSEFEKIIRHTYSLMHRNKVNPTLDK